MHFVTIEMPFRSEDVRSGSSTESDGEETAPNMFQEVLDKKSESRTFRSGPMPVHVAEEDDLDLFLESNMQVFRDKSFVKFSSKSFRKDFLKLLVEGDLLEVSLDEQQLLASLWYLLYRKYRDQCLIPKCDGDAINNDEDSASDISDTDLDLEEPAETDSDSEKGKQEEDTKGGSEDDQDNVASGANKKTRVVSINSLRQGLSSIVDGQCNFRNGVRAMSPMATQCPRGS